MVSRYGLQASLIPPKASEVFALGLLLSSKQLPAPLTGVRSCSWQQGMIAARVNCNLDGQTLKLGL